MGDACARRAFDRVNLVVSDCAVGIAVALKGMMVPGGLLRNARHRWCLFHVLYNVDKHLQRLWLAPVDSLAKVS